jgi:protein-S-isoprenylcysteine O-methyltransferase Ste14
MVIFHPLRWLFFASLHRLVGLMLLAVVLLALYWVIRLAVRHGTKDSQRP